MDILDLLSFVIAVFVLSMKPGPGMVAFVSRTLKDGMAPAYALFFGSLLAELIYISVAIFAIGMLSAHLVWLSLPLKLFGAGYLFWIGLQGLREHKDLQIQDHVTSRPSLFQDFTAGLFLGLGNPLIIAFYAGLLPMILQVGALEWAHVAVIYVIIVFVHLVCGSVQIVGADLMRQFFDTPRRVQAISQLASLSMIGVGVYILLSAIVQGLDLLSGELIVWMG